MTRDLGSAVDEFKEALLAPLRPVVDWLAELLVGDRETIETICPGVPGGEPADYAICVRGIFDRTLRCSRCGAAIPHPSHPTRTLH